MIRAFTMDSANPAYEPYGKSNETQPDSLGPVRGGRPSPTEPDSPSLFGKHAGIADTIRRPGDRASVHRRASALPDRRPEDLFRSAPLGQTAAFDSASEFQFDTRNDEGQHSPSSNIPRTASRRQRVRTPADVEATRTVSVPTIASQSAAG